MPSYASLLLPIALVAARALGAPVNATDDNDLVARVDSPDNPFINNNCFTPQSVGPGEKFTGCPPKQELTDGHYCKPQPMNKEGWGDHGCQSYCETSLEWNYAQEIPYGNSYCGRGSDCFLADTNTVQVTQSWTFGGGGVTVGSAAFNFGASYTYSQSKSNTAGLSRYKPDDQIDNCGYWTFVPHVVTSCGIQGKAEQHENVLNNMWCANRKDSEVCQSSKLDTSSGIASGDVIFVATDCEDRNKRLPCDQQDPIYSQEGVALVAC